MVQCKESCRLKVEELTASMEAQQQEFSDKEENLRLELDKVRVFLYDPYVTKWGRG